MKTHLLITFLAIAYTIPCKSQHKTVDIYFPDSVNEKEVELSYSIHGILTNYIYEPYKKRQKTTGKHLSFEIPDSIQSFRISCPAPYQWSDAMVLLLNPGEKLSICLDTLHAPKFKGDNADLYAFLYTLKKDFGNKRIAQTQTDFLENQSSISFYDFINRKIEESIFVLDSLLKNKQINSNSYEFVKKEIIGEYLFRAGYIGERSYFDTIADPDNFFTDLDKLFQQYDIVGDFSTVIKAKLRAFKLISGSKLDLGLDDIFAHNFHLDSNEQEIQSASEIIINTSVGRLDSLKLDDQRNLFKKVFPNSVYNPILAQLKASAQKDYIVASYSKKSGIQEFGRLEATDLKRIISMFFGGKPVFVDFWATWCGPCINEFAHTEDLKAFAKEHNIGILYVSVDDKGAYDRWKQRIEKSQIEGLHYFGTKEFAGKLPYFDKSMGIPRYVLLDKTGEVLIESCELPSSGKLIPQIKETLGL